MAQTDVFNKPLRLRWLLALGVLDLAAGAVAILAIARLVPAGSGRKLVSGLAGTVCSTILTLVAAEIGFMYVSRSHGVGYTLAAKSWFKEHWHNNAAGFRERDLTTLVASAKKKIVVIGDSFVAGHGIANPHDRFSDQLEELSQGDWLVANYGLNGADTRDEFQTLKNVPFRPDCIVLAYFGNDIRDAAVAAGQSPQAIVPYLDISPRLRVIVTNSYLLDFVYWAVPRQELKSWWSYYQVVYQDPEILRLHQEDLAAFSRYARSMGIPLVVVVFPYLHDLKASDIYVPWVRNLFEQSGVPVLNVQDFVSDLSKAERVVNFNDIHPSKVVHRRVAEKLLPLVRDLVATPVASKQ